MDYAVIETGGKQYRVKPGDVIEVDRLENDGDSITFSKILLSVADGKVDIGRPYLDKLSVSGKVLANEKGKKIRVARFTAKSRHRRVVGFRPSITRVQIENISAGVSPVAQKSVKAAGKVAPVKK